MDFLWIIVFILYMFFRANQQAKKKQEQQRQAQKRRKVIPVDGGTRDYQYEDLDDVREFDWQNGYPIEKTDDLREEILSKTTEKSHRYQKQIDRMKEKPRVDRKKRSVLLEDDGLETVAVLGQSGFSMNYDQRSLANAIVMSEILLPPRAMRPHGNNRR